MNRINGEAHSRPQTYLESALQSLGRITNTLNRSAVKYEVSPSRLKTSSSPRQKYQLDENSLSSIIQQTEKCQKMISQIMSNNVSPPPPVSPSFSKYMPNQVRNNPIQNNQNREQQIINQVYQKILNSGFVPTNNIQQSPYRSLKASGIRTSSVHQSNQTYINSLLQKLNIVMSQNDQLKRRLQTVQSMLIQKQMSQMNQLIKSIAQSQDQSSLKQIANLKLQKAKMNEQFLKQITKYNQVFKRLKHQNDLIQSSSGSSHMMNQVMQQNSRLLKQKQDDQKIIEELRSKVLSKHKHMRNLSRTMSKLCFNN